MVNALKTIMETQKFAEEPNERMEQLIESTLSKQECDQLKVMVSSFSKVFVLNPSE